jgi:predicted outer membrane repeat protein
LRRFRLGIFLGLLLLVSASGAGAADSAWPTAPVLEPDTLSIAHRASMEAEIAALRAQVAGDRLDFQVGETSFLRLTREERDRRLLHRPWPELRSGRVEARYGERERDGEQFDWRDNGGDFVTDIRDQGDCGACWDFAATAALESAFLIAIGGGSVPDFDLSEQHVLSCMDDYGLGSGCDGGWDEDVYWFARSVGMLEELCLPYAASEEPPCGLTCPDAEESRYFFGSDGLVCSGLNVQAVKDALHAHGPLSTTMTVYDTFEGYESGVYQASGSITGYHAVSIIGYNDTQDYFIAKNSWGTGWGMGGFFLIAYNSGCQFGNWTRWASFDPTGMGPFAAMAVADRRPETGEPVLFQDFSVPVSGEIVSWEWDFDGDGQIDATGPGPQYHTFTASGLVSPSLRVMDIDGQEDSVVLTDWLTVLWGGPVWNIDIAGGGPDGDGSPQLPFASIQLGLNIADPGDTVLVAPGEYSGLMNTELMNWGKELVLRASGEPGSVTLDGAGEKRLLILDSMAGGEDPGGHGLRIEGIRFTGGHDLMLGGAVLCQGATATFSDCLFEASTVEPDPQADGGAIWTDGDLTLERCSFTGNQAAGDGGAIYALDADIQLMDCVFTGNQAADYGGALLQQGGEFTLSHGSFEDNEAGIQGGALRVLNAPATLGAALFRGNRIAAGTPGMSGGGALSWEAAGQTLAIDNCIFTANEGPFGGAVLVNDGDLLLRQLSCWSNHATIMGGALALFGGEGSQLDLSNSIFWANGAPQNSQIMAPEAGPESLRHCLVQGGFIGVSIIDQDPLFEDPVAGDFHLTAGSPCLGAGLLATAPPLDYENLPRPNPAASQPDLGACESPLAGETAAPETASSALAFLSAFPNPFNPRTTFTFTLPEPAELRLLVYTSGGRLVATILDESMGAGSHQVTWTAQDDEEGQPLASGVYLVNLELRYADGRTERGMQKVMLVK